MVKICAVPAVAFTLISMAIKPSMATEIDCLYDSNSEWPWVDSRVCQLEERPLIFDDDGQAICSDPRADKDGDGWGWENNASCMIDPNVVEKQSNVPALEVIQKDLVVFTQDFESGELGAYVDETLNKQWRTPMWHQGIREGHAKIVSRGASGKALEVKFPAHQYGHSGAVAFLNDLSFGTGIDRNFEELYVSYDVKFADDFDFVRGGKLPGLCGYNIKQDPRDGCNTPVEVFLQAMMVGVPAVCGARTVSWKTMFIIQSSSMNTVMMSTGVLKLNPVSGTHFNTVLY